MAAVTVVASAYSTAGNGGRKVVKLSNGWIIVAVIDTVTANNPLRFYVSQDNGATWAQLCYLQHAQNLTSVAITSIGTMVYVLYAQDANPNYYVRSQSFDAATQADVNIVAGNVAVSAAQTALGAVTLTDDGTNLYSAWSSIDSTYPNSYNVQYSTSTDGGATWAAVTQVTTFDTAGDDITNPCIVISSGKPVIVCEVNAPTGVADHRIGCQRWTGAAWAGWYWVYSPGSTLYPQRYPNAVVESDEDITCLWQGKDSTDTDKFNICVSSSSDGGQTWAARAKLTSGNTYDQTVPSAGIDQTDDTIYLLFLGRASGSYDQIRKIVRTGGTWGAVADVTAYTTASANAPSIMEVAV